MCWKTWLKRQHDLISSLCCLMGIFAFLQSFFLELRNFLDLVMCETAIFILYQYMMGRQEDCWGSRKVDSLLGSIYIYIWVWKILCWILEETPWMAVSNVVDYECEMIFLCWLMNLFWQTNFLTKINMLLVWNTWLKRQHDILSSLCCLIGIFAFLESFFRVEKIFWYCNVLRLQNLYRIDTWW